MFLKTCAKFCATYLKCSSRDFLFFVFARILMCVTFIESFFAHVFWAWGTVKQRKLLNEWEISNKCGSYSKFLIYLYNYKLVSRNNVRIIFSHIIIYMILWIFFFRLSTRFSKSLMSLVGWAAGLDRLQDFFYLPFKTKTVTKLLAFSLFNFMKREPAKNISFGSAWC